MRNEAETAEPTYGLMRGAAAYRPVPAWGAWTALLITAAIVAIATVTTSLLVQFKVLARPQNEADIQGVALLLAWQLCVIGLTVAAVWPRRALGAALSLNRPLAGASVYAAALALMLAYQLLATALEYLFVPGELFRDLKPFIELARGPGWLLALGVVAVGAPLSEELLFRGFLLPALARSRMGFAGGALVTTTLWTTLHYGYSVVGLLEVFATGLLFSWLLWRSGSLRVTILCHAVYNGLIMLGLRYLPLPGAVLVQ